MSKTYTPLRYPGGKSQFYKQVVNILETNNITGATYIEPFAGGAGVGLKLLFEGKIDKIIINDIDLAVFSFWYTAINHNDWLVRRIKETDITISEWYRQKFVYSHPKNHSLKQLGFAFLFLNRCNRSGILHAGPIGGKNQAGKYKLDCRFNKQSIIELIKKIGEYKNNFEIYNLDASELIIKMRDREQLFWFIDPPYYYKGSELYKNSYDYNGHKQLAADIKEYLNNQTWILTYDVSDEIFKLYKEYKSELITLSYSVANKKKEKEYLFFNNLIVNHDVLAGKSLSKR